MSEPVATEYDSDDLTTAYLAGLHRGGDAAAATITALRARVVELEGVLEPFVALGDVVLAEAPPNATRFDAFQDCRGVTHKLELDDFRRAAILRAKGGEHGE